MEGGFSRTSDSNGKLCPAKGGFLRTSDIKIQLVRWKAGSHGRSCLPAPHLHAGDDLHDEKKQGRAAVGKGDEKVRADAYGEQD